MVVGRQTVFNSCTIAPFVDPTVHEDVLSKLNHICRVESVRGLESG